MAGIFDMGKLAAKAMKAKSAMANKKGFGKGGSLGLLINGLYKVVDLDFDREELKKELGIQDDALIDRIIKLFKKIIPQSMDDARANLEKELADSTSLDELKSILQD